MATIFAITVSSHRVSAQIVMKPGEKICITADSVTYQIPWVEPMQQPTTQMQIPIPVPEKRKPQTGTGKTQAGGVTGSYNIYIDAKSYNLTPSAPNYYHRNLGGHYGWVVPFLLLGLLILGVTWLITRNNNTSHTSTTVSGPTPPAPIINVYPPQVPKVEPVVPVQYVGLEKAMQDIKETGGTINVYGNGNYKVEFPKPEKKEESPIETK